MRTKNGLAVLVAACAVSLGALCIFAQDDLDSLLNSLEGDQKKAAAPAAETPAAPAAEAPAAPAAEAPAVVEAAPAPAAEVPAAKVRVCF